MRGILLGTISPLYIEGELRLNTWVAYLYEDDGIVCSIGFEALEEATSMSVEQFYEIFRNPTDKCIETPTNLWPTP